MGSVGSGSLAAETRPLVHAIPNDINSLDPADIKNQQDQEIGVNLYERLVEMKFIEQKDGTFKAHPTDVVPELAEFYSIDGPSITFKLRPGVKFYPTGNPLTSEDVRYSFERLVILSAMARARRRLPACSARPGGAVDPLTVRSPSWTARRQAARCRSR